jgi:ribosomal protein L37AE/L43A
MKPKIKLTQELVSRLYDGLQEYVSNEAVCPNCKDSRYTVEEHESYEVYTCTGCGNDYYLIQGETRLI